MSTVTDQVGRVGTDLSGCVCCRGWRGWTAADPTYCRLTACCPSAAAPMANLFTNLDMGLGARPFVSGGEGQRGAHAGKCSRQQDSGRGAAALPASPFKPSALASNLKACTHLGLARDGQHLLEPALRKRHCAASNLRFWAPAELCGPLLWRSGRPPAALVPIAMLSLVEALAPTTSTVAPALLAVHLDAVVCELYQQHARAR